MVKYFEFVFETENETMYALMHAVRRGRVHAG